MKKKALFFYFCLFLFLIFAPLLIFYSQGYRFDFQELKIVQTGGVFLKVKPKKAKIFVDGHFKKETDFFFGAAFIENLLPKKHQIRVEKEGFQKWEKELLIEAKKVTKAENIILWPKKIEFQVLLENIKEIYFNQDQTKAILLEEEKFEKPVFDESSPKEFEVKIKKSLKLYDFKRKIKSHLLEENDFREKKIEISNIFWINNEKVILEIWEKEKVNYYLLEFFPEVKLTLLKNFPSNVVKILPFKDKIFVQKIDEKGEKLLFLFDLKEKKALFFAKAILDFEKEKENIFLLQKDGFLYKINLSQNQKEKINQKKFKIKEGEIFWQILIKEGKILLKENSLLFYFNEEKKAFQKIFEGTERIAFLPQKIALSRGNELWLYFLKAQKNPYRKKDQKILLARFSKKIEKIFWLSPYYLLLKVGPKILIIETDNRDYPQVWEVFAGPFQKIYFDQKEKRIYLLQNNKLLTFSFQF